MKNIFTFGKKIPNLKINGKSADYPVLNERDARAGAGIMLVTGIFGFTQAYFLQNTLAIQILVILFTIEFILRVINPHIAPFYALGRLIVSKQQPEWVGATQKRFAWSLGLGLAIVMNIVIFGFEITYGILPLSICGICLLLMWFESAFGICLGCKMYYGLMSVGLIAKPAQMPACPGGVCEIPKR